MIKKLVNKFYTWFMFMINKIPHDELFVLYMEVTIFKNLNNDVK